MDTITSPRVLLRLAHNNQGRGCRIAERRTQLRVVRKKQGLENKVEKNVFKILHYTGLFYWKM